MVKAYENLWFNKMFWEAESHWIPSGMYAGLRKAKQKTGVWLQEGYTKLQSETDRKRREDRLEEGMGRGQQERL